MKSSAVSVHVHRPDSVYPNAWISVDLSAGSSVRRRHQTTVCRRRHRYSLSAASVPSPARLRLQPSGDVPRPRPVRPLRPTGWIVRQLEVHATRRRAASRRPQIPPRRPPVGVRVPLRQRSARLDGVVLRPGRSPRPSRRLPASTVDPQRLRDGDAALSAPRSRLLRPAVCARPVRRGQQRRSVVPKTRRGVDVVGPKHNGERQFLRGSLGGHGSSNSGGLQSYRYNGWDVQLVGGVVC